MCLYPTEKGLKKYDGKRNIFKFYKVFEIVDNTLRTPFRKYIISKPGRINLPKNSALDIEKNLYGYTTINGGCFHAYDFKRHNNMYNGWRVMIPIYVRGKDIIAADHTHGTVCFFSYEIKKEDWNKAFK